MLSKLASFLLGLIPFIFILALFKACTLFLGPSDEEKKLRSFFNEELVDVKSAEKIKKLCAPTNFKGSFTTKEGLILNCKDIESKVITVFLESLKFNKIYQGAIADAKPEWIKSIADMEYDHSGDSIDVILNFAEKSSAFCSVTIKVRSKKQNLNDADIFQGCTEIANACISKLDNVKNKIDFPCDPQSGMLAKIYIKEILKINE